MQSSVFTEDPVAPGTASMQCAGCPLLLGLSTGVSWEFQLGKTGSSKARPLPGCQLLPPLLPSLLFLLYQHGEAELSVI